MFRVQYRSASKTFFSGSIENILGVLHYRTHHFYSVFARDVTDLSSTMLEVQRTPMAAAHAEQPSRNALEKGIIHEIPLSHYAKSLESIAYQ